MAERPRHGMMGGNNESLVLYVFIFLSLERDTVVSRNKISSYILCICFRPQQPWTVEISIFNLYLDLISTLRGRRQHFQRERWCSSCPPHHPLLSSSHAAPYLTYHNLNQITSAQLAAPTMWPTSALKSTAFWDWSRIFPWELPTEPVHCECVECLSTLGKNLPPPSSLSFLPPLHCPPFSPLFFSTTSHPLKHSITL